MKTLIKKLLLVSVVLSLVMSGLTVYANDQSIKYTFKDGTLTVSGKGIADSFDKSVCEGKDVRKVVVEEGITELGKNALPHMGLVEKVTIAKTVKVIAQSAISAGVVKKLVMPGDFKCIVPPKREDQDWEEYYPYPDIISAPVEKIYLNSPIKKMNQTKYMSFDAKKVYTYKKDKKFKSYKGIIYTKNGKKLVYVPAYTKVLNVRKGCTTISMRSMTYSYDVQGDSYAVCDRLRKIVLPKSVSKVIDDTYEPAYNQTKNAKWVIKSKKINGTSLKNLALMLSKKALTKLMKKSHKNIKKVKGMWITKNHTLIRYDGKAKTVKIPKGVKTIADRAFENKKKIRTVKFPKSLRTIGEWAFDGCSKLRTVKWNKGLRRIDKGAFELTDLRKFKLPSSVKTFGEECFAYANISKITFPKSMTRIPNTMFAGLKVKNLVIPGYIKTIGRSAFSQFGGETILFKEGVETIESSAFEESGKVKQVTLAKSIKKIEERAFSEMDIKKLVLNGTNKIVDGGAFYIIGEIDCGQDPSQYVTFASLAMTTLSGKCEFIASKVAGASGFEVEVSKSKDFTDPIKKDLPNKSCKVAMKRPSDEYQNYRIRVYTNVAGSKIYGPWKTFSW